MDLSGHVWSSCSHVYVFTVTQASSAHRADTYEMKGSLQAPKLESCQVHSEPTLRSLSGQPLTLGSHCHCLREATRSCLSSPKGTSCSSLSPHPAPLCCTAEGDLKCQSDVTSLRNLQRCPKDQRVRSLLLGRANSVPPDVGLALPSLFSSLCPQCTLPSGNITSFAPAHYSFLLLASVYAHLLAWQTLPCILLWSPHTSH